MSYDAIIIGSGAGGLSAAVLLARPKLYSTTARAIQKSRHAERSEPDVFAVGRQSRVSQWPEYLRRKMESREIARKEREM
jgi:2-polyprenyl-6-methoxyphenol hydroxylase-like FAD-dependent oxidoreductase